MSVVSTGGLSGDVSSNERKKVEIEKRLTIYRVVLSPIITE